MNHLNVFCNSEFGELKIMISDEKVYFPATACAKVLGYKNPQEAIRSHCKGVRELRTPTAGGNQKMKFIPEGDLYRLIIRSNLPAAERFECWVFDEVLPELRKNKSYGLELQQIVSATVKEMLKEVLPLIENSQNKTKRNRANGKIDRLPMNIRNKVTRMIFEENSTYEEISLYLNEAGYDVHFSSVGRFKRKLEDETNKLFEG